MEQLFLYVRGPCGPRTIGWRLQNTFQQLNERKLFSWEPNKTKNTFPNENNLSTRRINRFLLQGQDSLETDMRSWWTNLVKHSKDLGHFWLCYIRIYRNPGTLGIDCSLSQLCTALELHCLNRHEKIGQGCGMQMLTIWFFIGTLVWKVSQILDMIDCTKLSCSPVYRVANIHDKESQF